ncbi:hypothetical protein [Aureimonas sp. Leaf454]|uniref:hypothetical protein n=1 Tax=Aureimonas sp. Leaf454 TaxID=1736381 RepID=UPI0012E3F952|nr:hypothetical protein [Aureimonas sp. Leaf454]
MSNTGEKTVDLSDRRRVGPEEESREDQFDGNEPEASQDRVEDGTDSGSPEARHDIEHSNDLTTP